MLNKFDVEFMESSVRECINAWDTKLICIRPKPIKEQPNWNKLMGEYSGEVLYNEIEVPAERKDQANYYIDGISKDNGIYGLRDDGSLMYAIPLLIPDKDIDGNDIMKQFIPDENDIWVVDNEKYYVRMIKLRIGETLIVINKSVGGTISGNGEDVI